VLYVLHRRELHGRYLPDAPPDPHDRFLLRSSAAVCVAVGPLFAIGLNPALVSSAAALALLVLVWRRDRSLLARLAVPWRMALGFAVLFVLVDVALRHGLREGLEALAGGGDDPAALARLAGLGALAANTVNNLPAYLALESVAQASPDRLMSLLVGVNVAPLVTPWASLATLLWAQRCRAAGVRIPPLALAAQGLLCAVVAGSLALLPLLL
jgi:arsenical pump membrane protein